MKVPALLVSIVLSIVIQPSSATIRPAMPKEVYEHLVMQGSTTLKGYLKNYACRFFPRSQSCQLAKKNRKALDTLTQLYLVRKNLIPDQYDFFNPNPRAMQQRSNQMLTYQSRMLRNTRSVRRFRRSIPGNPCTNSFASPIVHFYGEDVLEKEVVEILQNPASGEFQSFFTYGCERKGFNGMPCEPENMEYLAAVFTDVNQVSFRRIKLPTTCAIRVGTRG